MCIDFVASESLDTTVLSDASLYIQGPKSCGFSNQNMMMENFQLKCHFNNSFITLTILDIIHRPVFYLKT
jgi:hypothetical protein